MSRITRVPVALGELAPEQPKGQQLYALLEELLVSLPEGSAIPSERALAERHGVARMTVRNQIEELARAGRVTRVIGKGTFVAKPRVPIAPGLPSFSNEIAALGMSPGVAQAEVTTLVVDDSSPDQVQIWRDHPIMCLRRVRTADEIPMSIEQTYLSLDRFPGLETAPFKQISIRDFLQDEYGCHVVRAERRFTVARLEGADARQLRVSDGSAAFLSEVTTFDEADNVIEIGTALIRADRFGRRRPASHR